MEIMLRMPPQCPHGRQRYRCKECGGVGICEHGRERSQCKECGGSGLCKHGRQRSKCKECGGGGICEHGRERSRCKDCSGGGLFPSPQRWREVCKTVVDWVDDLTAAGQAESTGDVGELESTATSGEGAEPDPAAPDPDPYAELHDDLDVLEALLFYDNVMEVPQVPAAPAMGTIVEEVEDSGAGPVGDSQDRAEELEGVNVKDDVAATEADNTRV